MQFILRYAGQLNMDIDFEPAVPALCKINESAENEGMRLLALRALDVIGGESALRRLAERIPKERSDRVREHTLRVLTVHHRRGQNER